MTRIERRADTTMEFIDLVGPVTEFEQNNRDILDSISVDNSDVDQFLGFWDQLGFEFSDGVVAQGSVERLENLNDQVCRYRCGLELRLKAN